MYRDYGADIDSVSFFYHMYGADMGWASLMGSSDGGSSYTTLWSKSGNQGDAWYSADVTIGGGGFPQWLKFVYSYTPDLSREGGFALDDVKVKDDINQGVTDGEKALLGIGGAALLLMLL